MVTARVLGLVLLLGGLVPSVAVGQPDYSAAVPLGLGGAAARGVAPAPAAVEAYWTDARMSGATPMPLPRIPPARSIAPQGLAPSGPTVVANSGTAGEHPKEQRIAQGEAGVEPLAAGGSSFAYTRYRLFPKTQSGTYPYKAVGRLFFTIPGQGNFVCSGSVVSSANYRYTCGSCPPNDLQLYSPYFSDATINVRDAAQAAPVP